jgi:hypothetical protein
MVMTFLYSEITWYQKNFHAIVFTDQIHKLNDIIKKYNDKKKIYSWEDFNEIFIKIDPKLITIINGSYTYHIEISEKSTFELLNRFNFKLETVQKTYEHAILTKTKRSLNTILEDLTSNI